MGTMFRDLKADEIDVRVAKIFTGKSGSGVKLLFYKDARVDQNILDETVGPMNWQRKHDRDNANCIVSIWDDTKQQWISKEDTGTESKTEAAKGLASDSFKRACFNWGIGRELYTAPDTMVWNKEGNVNVRIDDNGRCKDRFAVTELTVKDGVITHVTVYNLNLRKVVYSYTAVASEPQARQNEQDAERQQVGPVTNETVRRAVQEGQEQQPQEPQQDLNAMCNDIELARLETIIHKLWPSRDIGSIFGAWPNVTKRQYAEFNQKIKNMQSKAK